MKPIKYAVSFVLSNPKNKKEFLLVKRPESDIEFPNVFGLPAATLKEGELSEQGVKRGGKEKLGCEIAATEFIGAMMQERKDYFLCMMDFNARLVAGEPDVTKANTTGTKYTDQKWTSHAEELIEECKMGSCCTQVFLNHLGLWPKEKLLQNCDFHD